jgi:hypothetical protein
LLSRVRLYPLIACGTVSRWAAAQGYPVTDLYTSHYISNLHKFNNLRKEDDGTFTVTVVAPDDCPLINYAVEQTGGWVAAIFRDPKKYIGARVDACSEIVTVAEWAKIVAEVSGKTVKTLGLAGGAAYLDGTEAKKHTVEEMYLNYLAFYKKCVCSCPRVTSSLTGFDLCSECPRDVQKSKEVFPEQWDTKAWILQSKPIKELLGL